MSQTQIRGTQLLNQTVQEQDRDVATVGQAVVAKILQGTNVSLSSTGGNAGTGDVTISVPGGGIGPAGQAAYTNATAGFTVPAVGSTVVVPVNNGAWAALNEIVWVQDAGGPGVAGAVQVTATGANSLTLKNITP